MITPDPILGFIFFGLEGIPLIAGLALAVGSSIRVCKQAKGAAIPLWLVFIWLVPFLGAIVALIVVKRPPPIAETREHPAARPDALAFEERR